jgi:hypothetical protein
VGSGEPVGARAPPPLQRLQAWSGWTCTAPHGESLQGVLQLLEHLVGGLDAHGANPMHLLQIGVAALVEEPLGGVEVVPAIHLEEHRLSTGCMLNAHLAQA